MLGAWLLVLDKKLKIVYKKSINLQQKRICLIFYQSPFDVYLFQQKDLIFKSLKPWNSYSSITSKPIYIRWIKTGAQP